MAVLRALSSRSSQLLSPPLAPPSTALLCRRGVSDKIMAAKYIAGSVLGSLAVAYACDHFVGGKKIFGGTTPRSVSDKEWWEETDKKFQAWPRTGGPPVVMNPISRQNFIVKSDKS